MFQIFLILQKKNIVEKMQITANFDIILRNANFWKFFVVLGVKSDFFFVK